MKFNSFLIFLLLYVTFEEIIKKKFNIILGMGKNKIKNFITLIGNKIFIIFFYRAFDEYYKVHIA